MTDWPCIFESYTELLVDEVRLLEGLPDAIWQRLGEVVDAQAWCRVREAVLHSVHVSLAYLTRLCLKPAAGLPWSLCRGDVIQNLHSLAQQELDDTHNSATRQIQALVKLGINQADLQDAIRLLGQVGWTTKGVEEQHASLAHLHRAHPDIDATHLSLRAYIHACRVFWRPDRSHARLDRLQKLLQKTRERRGRHISGENIFFKELHGRVRSRMTGHGARAGVQQHILKQSRIRWGQLGARQKQRYRLMAREATQTKLAENKMEEEALRTQIQMAATDLEEEKKRKQGLNALSACRFSAHSKQVLIEHHGSSSLTRDALQHFTDRLGQPPAALSQDEVHGLEAHQPDHHPPELPDWGRVLCHHRDLFKDCVIRHRHGWTDKAWLFLCGLQKPYVGHWLPVRPMLTSVLLGERCGVVKNTEAVAVDDATHIWRHHWSYGSGVHYLVEWSELPGSDEVSSLEVIPHAHFLGRQQVVSDSEPVPWMEFTKGLPARQGNRSQSRKLKASEDLLQAHPWLSEVLGDPQAAAHGSQSSDSSDDESAQIQGLQHTDEAIEAAWKELQDKRSELSDAASTDTGHFAISIRGGAYTFKKAGVAADCVVCFARDSLAKSFCREFKLQQMYSFAFKKFTEPAAMKMAAEVCARLEHWYALHLELVDDTADFTDEMLATYTGQDAFESWCGELSHGSATALRASAIQAMRPSRLPGGANME